MIKYFLILNIISISQLFAFDHSYQDFDNLLQKHVHFHGKQSYVDYKSLKSSPKALESILENFTSISKQEYEKWTREQKISFLINSYNAFTLKLIIDHYPVASIKKIGSFFSNPWKKKFFTFLGEKSYLDDIEHNILRKNFQEPRIHFAVVCASISCPVLQKSAYQAQKLNSQLEAAAQLFLGDTSKNKIEIEKKEIHLSKIFDWYGGDFKLTHQSYLHYVAPYLTNDEKVQQQIIHNKFDIDFLSYDWGLNDLQALPSQK